MDAGKLFGKNTAIHCFFVTVQSQAKFQKQV